jgi:type II secretory pathway pseudopilin PulG
MELNLTAIVIAMIGIFGSIGFWNFKIARAKAEDDKNGALNQLLIREIEELKDKVDILLRDKEELLQEISYLRAELASTKAELHAVNNMLRYGRDHHG